MKLFQIRLDTDRCVLGRFFSSQTRIRDSCPCKKILDRAREEAQQAGSLFVEFSMKFDRQISLNLKITKLS